jgi:hypothetical protein
MKKTRWVNFVWDLAETKLPVLSAPRQFRLSLVKAAERRQLQEVIEKSFALDPGWNAALHMQPRLSFSPARQSLQRCTICKTPE